MTSAVRVVLAACAGVIIVFALARGSDVRACDSARTEAFALGVTAQRGNPAPVAADGRFLARRLTEACRGSDALVPSAQALVIAGALDGADRLARTAVRRDPDAFQAHNALASVLAARGDTRAAARERALARRLNPLAPPPAAPVIDADGRPSSG